MARKLPTNWPEFMAYQADIAKRRAAAAKGVATKALRRDPAHRAQMEALLQELLAEG